MSTDGVSKYLYTIAGRVTFYSELVSSAVAQKQKNSLG